MTRNSLIVLTFLMISSSLTYDNLFYGEYLKNAKTMNALSPVRNQNQPKICGASWAFAIASSLSDQFNIKKDTNFPEVVLSPQMLISCMTETKMKTCEYLAKPEDADIAGVLEKLKADGLSDESCNNWHSSVDQECDQKGKCMDCGNGENIKKQANCFSRDYHSYKLKSFAKIVSSKEGEEINSDLSDQIYDALKTKGPVVCNMKHSKNLFESRIKDIEIYTDDGTKDYNTWVSVVGYSNIKLSDPAKSVWMVKLSFGDNVGHFGYLYLDADPTLNSNEILSNCYSLDFDPVVEVINNSSKSIRNLFKPVTYNSFDISKPRFEPKIKTDDGLSNKEVKHSMKDGEGIFWGNVDGFNYMTWIKNQHIPVYCGSCWAQAATSVLSDRLNIKNINAGNVWPRHVLSVQAVINCRLGGTCLGGDSGLVFQKALNWKIPTETCRTYEAQNPDIFSCVGESICSNSNKEKTFVVENYNGLTVEEWVNIRGEAAMKEHLKDGPIACSFEVTDEFENFAPKDAENSVFEQQKDFFQLNHAISVVGWGTDDKGLFWRVRNSWGIEYGYNGLFNIRGGNTLGIESGCVVPTKFTFRSWDTK